MSGLKKIIVAIGLLLFISLLFSCKFNDLVEQEGIIYELVEQNNTSKSFYRVKSASKDIEKAVITSEINGITVTDIGEGAFYGCTELKSVSLPDGLTYIDSYAFENCISLTKLKLPSSLKHIGADAVLGCINLSEISVDENNQHFITIDGNLYSEEGKKFEIYLPSKTDKTFELPKVVESIEPYAFCENKHISSIILNCGIKNIEYEAFKNCESLESLELKNGIERIASFAFSNCKKLKELKVPQTVKYIGAMAFENCESLESIVLPIGLETIDNVAFANCKKLTSIYIPISVKTIGQRVFSGCYQLTIYCEVANAPSGWTSEWYGDAAKIVWEVKYEI